MRNEKKSFINADEHRVVEAVVRGFLSAGIAPSEIGVIWTYKGQVEDTTAKWKDDPSLSTINVITVDGSQGEEWSIVIVGTIRGGEKPSLGHVRDKRRVNVAITRAKEALIVVGDVDALDRDQHIWSHFIREMRSTVLTEKEYNEWLYDGYACQEGQ